MNTLSGKVFPSGVIEFSFAKNPWAVQWLEGMRAKNKTSSRIIIDPKRIPVTIERTDGLDATDFNWLDRIQKLVNSADSVWLRIIEGSFRFQKCVHEFSATRELVTLGANEIEPYAKKYWQKIKYFYAFRYEGFSFDVRKIVSNREGKEEPDSFELFLRIRPEPNETSCHLSFLATGSTVSNEIINWRNTIEKGESGRFSVDLTEARFKVLQAKRPLTFLHEVREEFHNHSYEFEGDQIKSHLQKAEKRAAT